MIGPASLSIRGRACKGSVGCWEKDFYFFLPLERAKLAVYNCFLILLFSEDNRLLAVTLYLTDSYENRINLLIQLINIEQIAYFPKGRTVALSLVKTNYF